MQGDEYSERGVTVHLYFRGEHYLETKYRDKQMQEEDFAVT